MNHENKKPCYCIICQKAEKEHPRCFACQKIDFTAYFESRGQKNNYQAGRLAYACSECESKKKIVKI